MSKRNTGNSRIDEIEVNVGYDGNDGKKVAMGAALDVVREFESLDVVTIRIPRERWSELEDHPAIRYVERNGEMGALDGER